MHLIDSHCHLQAFARRGELSAVLERAGEAGVSRMITVGTSEEDWTHYRELHQKYPEIIHYTVGLHPTSVTDEWRDQVNQLSTYFIPPDGPAALGEIGLDHFHLPGDPIEAARVIQRQEMAFQAQLELAHQLECPVVIHSRNAVKDCIRFVDEAGIRWERVVFHCWSDGPELIREIVSRGGAASFTGIVTYKNAANVRKAALEQGLGRLMIETDAPYLAPVPMRGKENEPAYVSHVAESMARTLGVSLSELSEVTAKNTRNFFQI